MYFGQKIYVERYTLHLLHYCVPMQIVMFYSQGTYLNTSSKSNTNWRHIADTIYGLYYVFYDPCNECCHVPHNYKINPNWIWNIRSLLPRVLSFCKQQMHEYLNHPIKVLTHIFLIVFIYLFMLTIKSRSPFTQHIFGFEWCISEVAYNRNMMNLPMYRTTVPPSIKDVCRAIGKTLLLG